MRKHNRDLTIISTVLGFTAFLLFVDGLLRMIGIIPPFLHLDVNIIDGIIDKVTAEYLSQMNWSSRFEKWHSSLQKS